MGRLDAAIRSLEHQRAIAIVRDNVFDQQLWHDELEPVRHFLDFYLLRREDIPIATEEEKQQAIVKWEESVHNS